MKKLQINKKTAWIIAIIVLVLAVVLFFVFRKKKTENGDEPGTDTLNANLFPLKVGSQGDYVRKLQEFLLEKGSSLPQYGVDGIFGEETKQALISVLGTNQVDLETYKRLIA